MTTEHEQALTTIKPINQAAAAYVDTVDSIEVTDEDSLAMAGDLLKELQLYRKRIEDKRTELTGPLNKTLKGINAMFKAPRDQIDKLIGAVRSKMNKHVREQERIAREEREREAREAAEREERLREEAQQLQEDAHDGAAAMVSGLTEEADRAADEAVKAVARRSAPARGRSSTVSATRRWTGTVVNVHAACRAIAEGKLPADIVSFNQRDLNDLAKACSEEKTEHGIRFEQVVTAGVR